jgi:beta-galactosidase
MPESPVIITVQPKNQSVIHGSTATFFVIAKADGVLSYQWFTTDHAISIASGFTPLPGAEADGFWQITGAQSSSYTTPVLSTADNGFQFICLVTNVETVPQSVGGLNVTNTPQQTQQVLFTEMLTAPAFLLVS